MWFAMRNSGSGVCCEQRACVVSGVYFLSPLLHSLTRTISTDSVVAMTVGLLLLHLFLHDYK